MEQRSARSFFFPLLHSTLQGKFMQTVLYGGHRYGLTRDAIEAVATEGLACCVHMELEVRTVWETHNSLM